MNFPTTPDSSKDVALQSTNSCEELSRILQSLPDALLMVDSDASVIMMNRRTEDLFGFTRDELLGQPIEILVPERFRDRHRTHRSNYLAKPHLLPMGIGPGFIGLRKDGSEFPVEISLSPVTVNGVALVLCIVRDVTEQRRLANKTEMHLMIQKIISSILHASLSTSSLNDLLEYVLDQLFTIPWIAHQSKGAIFLAGDSTRHLVMKAQRGLPPGALRDCGQVAFGKCMCSIAAERLEPVFASHVDERHSIHYEGMEDHGHYCLPVISNGKLLGVVSIDLKSGHVWDPLEQGFLCAVADAMAGAIMRKQVIDALRKSEERFSLAVQGTDAGIWDWDLQTNQVFFSARWKSMLGCGEDEIAHEYAEWERRIHPEDRVRALKTLGDYLDGTSATYELEHRLQHKDGSYRWILSRGAAVRDEGGRPHRIVGSHLDITRSKQAEEELEASLRQLREARDTLELRVQERTSELRTANSQLQEANRKLSEVNLRFSQSNEQLARANENMLSFLDQFEVGVVMIGPEGGITFLNQAAERIVGENQGEAAGQQWERILPFQDKDKARLEEMCRLTPRRRSRISVHWQGAKGRHYQMEVEVKDDPRDPARKIFLLYDVSEISDLRHMLDDKTQFQGICGQSTAIRSVYQKIQNVAQVDATVLIEGETGTGKELVARAIHYSSARKAKPFLAVNCAGLTESLLTSQLFGHRRGSFTGAVADQLGMFEAASGGTLFLDEIGDIPIALQTTLLRVLQEKEITRLGETQPRKVDVRIIAASHRNLNDEVASGRFREDLFYRVRVTSIRIPPLRDRLEDVPLLVAWFLGQIRASRGLPVTEVSGDALKVLMEYRWPGNVRELKSAIESAVIHSNRSVIMPNDLPAEVFGLSSLHATDTYPEEKTRILDALDRVDGNRAAAARLLGVSRATLYRTMARLNIRSKE